MSEQVMKKVVLIVIAFLLLISCFSECSSSRDYPYGYEECFRCQGSGLVNEGFIDFNTCPTCRGSGMLDSH